MKKLFLILLILMLPCFVFSNTGLYYGHGNINMTSSTIGWLGTNSTTSWYFDSTNNYIYNLTSNVGIGIIPSQRLTVYEAGTETQLMIRADNDQSSGLYLGSTANDISGYLVTTHSTGRMDFGGTAGNTMVLDNPNKRVGIGTTAPTSKLSVGAVSGELVRFFYDNVDVADNENGPELTIYRRAAEGDDYIRMYIDQYQSARFISSGSFIFDALGGGNRITFSNGGTTDFWMGGGSSVTGNPVFRHHGYLTATADAEYVQWKLDDTNDTYKLTRESSNIAGFEVDMPILMNGETITGQTRHKPLCFTVDMTTLPNDTLFAFDNFFGVNATIDSIKSRSNVDDQAVVVVIRPWAGGAPTIIDSYTIADDGQDVYTDTQTTITSSTWTKNYSIGIVKGGTGTEVVVHIWYHLTEQKGG